MSDTQRHDKSTGGAAAALRRLALATFAIFSIAAIGCGSNVAPNRLPVFPTKGQVSFQGTVAAGAFVVLHPHGMSVKDPAGEIVRPHGIVREDGSFELTSYETGDGAPAGEYSVTVELRKVVKYPSGGAGPGPNLVPKKYTKPDSSTLIVYVKEGTNHLPPIVLKEEPAEKQAAVGRTSSPLARGL